MPRYHVETPCARCGGTRELPEQGYCRSCRAAYMRDYRGAGTGEHRRRDAARAALRHLVRIGAVERQPCEVCGRTDDVEGHHTDYDQVADVRWLCPAHHAAEPKDRLATSSA